MSQYVMHRDPRYFDRAEDFDPDRWSSGLMKRLPKYVYFPFGAGPRVCIGNSFAMLEAILAVATVVPRYQFSMTAHPPVVPWPSVTLRPREGIHAIVHERTRGAASESPDHKGRAPVVPV